MGTSIAAAIDYLVAGLPSALTAVDSTAIVLDGIITSLSESMVVIGKATPESSSASSGQQQPLVLGAGRVQEDYEIPCIVFAQRSGPLVKTARDAAVAMFDVVAHFVAADRTFGGVLLQGRFAEIGPVQIEQEPAESGGGLVVWFSFSIHCRNHYIP